jgi:sporulation protein YlmC with PRC-barrel domain
MLQLSESLLNRPIMSLRTGGQVGIAQTVIINPDNLKIEGFHCIDRFSKEQLVLLAQDIRDFTKQGFIVNDHEVLTNPDELIRLQKILKLKFELINKPVETESKKRVGRVHDFATDMQSLYIQKLYVGPSLIKSLTKSPFIIDRTQIIEITSRRIVIKDLDQPVKAAVPVTAVA